MRAFRFGLAILFAAVLLGGAMGAAGPAHAQSDAELDALGKRARQLFQAGKYAEAVAANREFVSLVEKSETASAGKPGSMTAIVLGGLSWYALHARSFDEALAAAERALTLAPHALWIETNRAHALLFLGRFDEARALYLAHAHKRVSPGSTKIWDDAVAEDFESCARPGSVMLPLPT